MENEIITIDELRRRLLVKALNRAGRAEGARRLLGITRRTLFRWKKNYGIDRCPVTKEYFIGTRYNTSTGMTPESKEIPIQEEFETSAKEAAEGAFPESGMNKDGDKKSRAHQRAFVLGAKWCRRLSSIERAGKNKIHPVFKGWDSIKLCGRMHERYQELIAKGLDERGFNSGWIEGRAEMLQEMRHEWDEPSPACSTRGSGEGWISMDEYWPGSNLVTVDFKRSSGKEYSGMWRTTTAQFYAFGINEPIQDVIHWRPTVKEGGTTPNVYQK